MIKINISTKKTVFRKRTGKKWPTINLIQYPYFNTTCAEFFPSDTFHCSLFEQFFSEALWEKKMYPNCQQDSITITHSDCIWICLWNVTKKIYYVHLSDHKNAVKFWISITLLYWILYDRPRTMNIQITKNLFYFFFFGFYVFNKILLPVPALVPFPCITFCQLK